MENTFQYYLRGNTVKNLTQDYFDIESDTSNMYQQGILIRSEGFFSMNPVLVSSKNYSDAKRRMRSLTEGWIKQLDKATEWQLTERSEQVEYFTINPVTDLHGSAFSLPGGTPAKYQSGKGYAYIMDGEIITLHFGFKAPNSIPFKCERFKFEVNFGFGLLEM
tara:strand:- start:2357 stop:2845 length:489 start_codon:yes stop_codon:yes gene_type:complete